MHAIHIVSGGTGASAQQLVQTVLAQFPGAEFSVRVHAQVRDERGLEEVMQQASESSATVVHTLVAERLREQLVRLAEQKGLVEIDLAGPLLERLAWVSQKEAAEEPGRYRLLRSEYFGRIEAVEYAVEHDDGRRPDGWHQADVVLIGTSRVGKTPLCMYLAAHGWKAANLPLVREVPLPVELLRVPKGKIVGLSIDPVKLAEHRWWRARQLGLPSPTKYDSQAGIEQDVAHATELFRRQGYAVVDVTDKPVEEIARAVMERVKR